MNNKTENFDVYEENDVLTQYFQNRKAFTRNKVAEQECGNLVFTLFVPKQNSLSKRYAQIANLLLAVLWLPMLIIGVITFVNSMNLLDESYLMAGCIVGMLIGMVCHEFGHALSCVAYGGTTYEMGVTVKYLIPGAYALIELENIKKRMHRIQVYAAGVETNFLLAGVFLIMSSYIPGAGTFFLCMALSNASMALINLLFAEGLDGNSIISELLGIDNPSETVTAVVKSRKKILREKGMNGFVLVAVCRILQCMKITMLLIIITNIIEVISLCL